LELLKLSSDKRKEIGKTLSDQITSVSGSLSGLAERWDVNEAYYRNDMAIGTSDYDPQVSSDGLAVRLWNGQKWQRASVHTPLVQPICDSIADNIANIVLGQTNFCTAKANGGGSDKSNSLTEEVQWHMSNAIIDSKIQKAAEWCSVLNMAIMRVRFEVSASKFLPNAVTSDVSGQGDIAFAGIQVDCIHPRDFIAYPHDVSDISQCRLLAHRWRKMHTNEIEEMQDAGRFYKIDEELVDSDADTDDVAPSEKVFDRTSKARDGEDTFPTLWTGLFKAKLAGDKNEVWYEFILAKETQTLLSVTKYELSRPWYVPFYLKEEYGGIYPSNSTAQNIQQLQTVQNELFSTVIDAATLGVYPMFVQNTNGIGADKIETWEPLKVLETVGDTKDAINMLSLRSDLNPLLASIQQIQSLAERTARVSSNDMGTSFQGGMTATESAQIAQGTATKKNAMLNSFSNALTQVWSLAQQLLAQNYTWIRMAYGDATPLSGAEDAEIILSKPVKWEVTGKSAASTPEQQFQYASQLLTIGLQLAGAGLPVYKVEQLASILADTSQLPGSQSILTSEDERKQIAAAGQSSVPNSEPGMEGATASSQEASGLGLQ